MELHELQILEWQTRPRNHRIPVTRASMRARAAEIRPSIPSGGQDRLMCTEPVQSTVLHIQGDHTDALAVLHNEVERKVLDEEVCVVPERLAIERVQECVACSVCGSGAAIRLPALAKLERLSAEGTLVNLALLRPREGQAEMLELGAGQTRRGRKGSKSTRLNDGIRSLATHVVDGVLVAEPVGTFYLKCC